MDTIKDAIHFDGFIYCIINNTDNTNTCKIGKTEMKDSLEITLQKLLNRYSTYYPDCKIYKFIRVSNCHNAEIDIFKILNSIHYKKEHFYWDESLINDAFNEIQLKYPDINSLLIHCDIKTLNQLNRNLRQYFNEKN